MKKQTAVSLLVEKLFKKGVDTTRFIPEIEQALEMEKQQIMDAHFEGSEIYRRQYYKETYED